MTTGTTSAGEREGGRRRDPDEHRPDECHQREDDRNERPEDEVREAHHPETGRDQEAVGDGRDDGGDDDGRGFLGAVEEVRPTPRPTVEPPRQTRPTGGRRRSAGRPTTSSTLRLTNAAGGMSAVSASCRTSPWWRSSTTDGLPSMSLPKTLSRAPDRPQRRQAPLRAQAPRAARRYPSVRPARALPSPQAANPVATMRPKAASRSPIRSASLAWGVTSTNASNPAPTIPERCGRNSRPVSSPVAASRNR